MPAPSVGLPRSQDQPNLDLLRAVAVACVFIYHLSIALGRRVPVDIGHIGVLLFFVHTSLVLMMSLERIEARRQPLFGSFYLRRVFRIYPLSVVCVLAIVGFGLPHAPWWPFQAVSATTLAANLLLCMNFFYITPVTSVLWSLPYEIQMYALLPLLYVLGRRHGVRAIWLTWLLSLVAGIGMPMLSGRLDIFLFVPCFLAGVLAFFLGFGTRPMPLPPWVWVAVLALAAAVFHIGNTLGQRHAAGWTMCLLVGAAAPLCRPITSPSEQRVCAAVAKYSYGVYLTHLQVMWVAFVVLAGRPAWVQWAALALLGVALPVLLFHLIESPFMRWGGRLAEIAFPERPATGER